MRYFKMVVGATLVAGTGAVAALTMPTSSSASSEARRGDLRVCAYGMHGHGFSADLHGPSSRSRDFHDGPCGVFRDVRAGMYRVVVDALSSRCEIGDESKRVRVRANDSVTVRFVGDCRGRRSGDHDRGSGPNGDGSDSTSTDSTSTDSTSTDSTTPSSTSTSTDGDGSPSTTRGDQGASGFPANNGTSFGGKNTSNQGSSFGNRGPQGAS